MFDLYSDIYDEPGIGQDKDKASPMELYRHCRGCGRTYPKPILKLGTLPDGQTRYQAECGTCGTRTGWCETLAETVEAWNGGAVYTALYDRIGDAVGRPPQDGGNMAGVIRVLDIPTATEKLREAGMRISPEALRRGLEQGKYPFGIAILMDKEYIYQVYESELMRWIEARAI